MKSTRQAYGEVLVELGRENKDIVVLDADLSKSTMTCLFAKEFPERFFDFGVAEQNMMATSAGFAFSGKIPFASTFAIFAAGRAWDQVRNSIAYPKANVKIAATHSGISVGEDGASHQAIEDIATMTAIPNMIVLSPADETETKKLIRLAVKHNGPVYIRLGRQNAPDIFDSSYEPKIGKGTVVREGNNVCLVATGIMVSKAVEAARILESEGISAAVVDISTIKPIDKELIVKMAKQTKAIVTCEDHNIVGGLGSMVATVLAENFPTKLARVGIQDTFAESGKPEDLFKKYSLDEAGIISTVKELLRKVQK